MSIQIRNATIEDLDPLFSLAENFATSFTPNKTDLDHSLQHLLRDESVLMSVAVVENEVVGYCLAFDHYTFYANGRVTWVEEIMTREDLREKGIGRNLMASVETWAASRQSKLIGLATRRAADFYTAIGYEESAIFFRKMIER